MSMISFTDNEEKAVIKIAMQVKKLVAEHCQIFFDKEGNADYAKMLAVFMSIYITALCNNIENLSMASDHPEVIKMGKIIVKEIADRLKDLPLLQRSKCELGE